MANRKIAGFDERLAIIVRTLVVPLSRKEEIGNTNILDVNDIHVAMCAGASKHQAKSRKQWENDRKTGNVSDDHINFILKLYRGDLTFELLCEGTIEQFRERFADKMAARARWEAAARHLMANRHLLTATARQFYAAVDEAQQPGFRFQNFPLVARRDWILPRPLALTEITDPSLLPMLTHPKLALHHNLEGLEVNAIEFKTALTERRKVKRTGSAFHNGLSYRVLSMDRNADGIDLSFSTCGYYDYVNTCEFMALELADADLAGQLKQPEHMRSLRGEPASIFDFHNRNATLGVNCLTILKGREVSRNHVSHTYLYHRRGELTLEAPNCVHVVPAGGHQPLSDKQTDLLESQVWMTAAREFLEEVLGQEELDLHAGSKHSLLTEGKSSDLFRALFRGHGDEAPMARIFLLGVGIDPAVAKPEILLSIVIDWRRLLRSTLSEVMQLHMPNGEFAWNYEGRGEEAILSREALLADAEGFRRSSPDGKLSLPTQPAGAACMMIAAEHLKELLQ